MERIKAALTLLAEKQVIKNSAVKETLELISLCTSIKEALEGAEFVLESVFEDYPTKKRVFEEMDSHASEETILASGSSQLLITEIQKAAKNPERCIGVHGFNPPHLVPLVEIVKGEKTSAQTVQRTKRLMEQLGKKPVVPKKEVSAYLANPIQNSVFMAVQDIVESGITTVEEVDLAVSARLGLRWAVYGPFMVYYFNTPSHLVERRGFSGLIAEGMKDYSLIEGKTYEAMVRWRDGKLVDLLRVLGHLS